MHTDNRTIYLTPGRARSILASYGIPSTERRGRVYSGSQRVPLTLAGIARLLGVPTDRIAMIGA